MIELEKAFMGKLADEVSRRAEIYARHGSKGDGDALYAAARILTAMSYSSEMQSSTFLCLQDAEKLLKQSIASMQ